MDPTDVQNVLKPYGVEVVKVLGERLQVRCPFLHNGRKERHPSMAIYTQSGTVICFACGYRKPLDRFLIDVGMSRDQAQGYREVLRTTRVEREKPKERSHELAAWVGMFRRFYPKILLEPGPQEPGHHGGPFTRETLDRFEVGYDTRYQRVTYPIYDKDANLVAIVGGATNPQDSYAKYKLFDEEINLPKNESQEHRNHLWGLHLMPTDQELIVVEGYKAALWLAQNGFSAVATQGTGFTKAQVETLDSLWRPVLIMMDQDDAGKEATRRLYTRLVGRIGHLAQRFEYPRPDAKQPDWLSAAELTTVLGGRR